MMISKRWHPFLLTILLLLIGCFSSALAATESGVVILNVSNTPIRGDVILSKTGLQLVRFTAEKDAYGNTCMKPVYENGYLAGAVFELRAAENIVGKEGTVFYQKDALIQELTTSGTGSVKSDLLPLGKYYLVETSAPEGYVFSTAPCNFTLSATNHTTAVVELTVSASNTYLPVRVTLHKEKENLRVTETSDGMVHQTVERVDGEGFVFGLYNHDVISYSNGQNLPANTLMATGATNASGNLTFSGMYPHGEYYVKELSVPDGWNLSTQTYAVTLTPQNKAASENVIVVSLAQSILNELIYTPVTITKTDISGEETLPGALIEVSDAAGKVIYREYTDENGELPNIPIVPGSYTFKEIYAPEGYALNTAVTTFTVTVDGKVSGTTTIRDDVNKVMLKKTRQNGDVLSGAVFGIFDKDDQKVQEATSDKSGLVTFFKLGFGTYTIRELSTPYGYHISTKEWTVTINSSYQNPTTVLDTVLNEDAPGWVKLTKLDALDDHPITGVQFDIYSANADSTTGDLVTSIITDKDGMALSASLLVGDYVVREHESPTGYASELWSENVTVKMDETLTFTVKNTPMQGSIRILKTDEETQKPLPGAAFTVTRISGLPSHNGEGDGEIVAIITSDENGVAETPLLTWGEYEITESGVPDDYLDEGYSVRVFLPEFAK